ncbi:hypothetical protein [Pseudonocardia yunnanensis]
MDRGELQRRQIPRHRTKRDDHMRAHRSIAQAGRVAREAGAAAVVLHHFVPANRPQWAQESIHDHFEPAVVGEDGEAQP